MTTYTPSRETVLETAALWPENDQDDDNNNNDSAAVAAAAEIFSDDVLPWQNNPQHNSRNNNNNIEPLLNPDVDPLTSLPTDNDIHNNEDDQDWDFTPEELLAALSLPDDNQETLQLSLPDDNQPLPEIPLSAAEFQHFRDTLVGGDQDENPDEDSNDWSHVFDEPQSDASDTDKEEQLHHQQQHQQLQEEDTTTLDLLAQLEGLQLAPGNDTDPSSSTPCTLPDGIDNLEFDPATIAESDYPPIFTPDGDVQPWLYCQPCQPPVNDDDPSLQAFLEPWNYASNNQSNPANQASTDIDQLLSQLSIQQQHQHYDTDDETMNRVTPSDSNQSPPAAGTPPRGSQTNRRNPSMQALQLSFNVKIPNDVPPKNPPNRTLCLGHRERILGVDISPCGRYFATASGDSTIRIWKQQRLLATLRGHDADHECLRVAWASPAWIQEYVNAGWERTPVQPHHDVNVKSSVPTTLEGDGNHTPRKILETFLLASGGADGVVYLWTASTTAADQDPTEWRTCATLDHTPWAVQDPNATKEEPEKPQIYALALIDDWYGLPNQDPGVPNAFVLSSCDNHIHLWEWQPEKSAHKKVKVDDNGWTVDKMILREVFSVRFGSWHDPGYGVTVGQVTGSAALDLPMTKELAAQAPQTQQADEQVFGGKQRNPHGIVYVFDAAYSAALGCLGVALSDGTVRLLNGRGICWSVLQLPHVQAHLTSLAWAASTNILATAVATGEVVTWQVWPGHTPVCRAILAGGHVPGRPLFGVGFYSVAAAPSKPSPEDSAKPPPPEALLSWGIDGRICAWDPINEANVEQPEATLVDDEAYPLFAVACTNDKLVAAGGGADGGFIGIPVHYYAIEAATEPEARVTATTESASKAKGESSASTTD